MPSPAVSLVMHYINHLKVERYVVKPYATSVRNVLLMFLAHARVTDPARVTPAHLEAFLARRPAAGSRSQGAPGLSDATRYKDGATVKRWAAWATAEGLLARDPLARVRLPQVPEGPPRDVSLADIATLLASVATDERMWLAVWLHYGAGLRVSEAARARVEDVVFGDAPFLRVRRSKNRKERIVDLGETVASVLAVALARRPSSGPLLPNRKYPGEHLSAKTVTHLVSGAMRAAGIHATAHQLRHSFATQLLWAGVDVATLQEELGHENRGTTWRYTKRVRRNRADLDRLPDPRRVRGFKTRRKRYSG